MISRTSLTRSAQLASRQTRCAALVQARTFASAAPSGNYEASDVNGLKVAARDSHGPTTKLAVVSKAGSRYQPLPGLTAALESFAFKNTQKRSALRIVRESELLGGQLTSYHSREGLVLEASFLSEDLPYFAELLGEVVTQTKYTTHEFHEEVLDVIRHKQAVAASDPATLALDGAHAVAFHRGLGSPLNASTSVPTKKYLSEYAIADFAGAAYSKPNMTLVADGASSATVSKWAEQFFKAVPSTASSKLSLDSSASKYFGGEQRTAHSAGNSMVIAFPGSSYTKDSPEIAVLSALLNGQSGIKWSSGFSLLSKALGTSPGLSVSSSNLAYSDAGLFAIQLSGPAAYVRNAAEETVKALKAIAEGGVGKEDLTKAIARAKFDALEASERRGASMLLAGSGLLQAGKPFNVSEIIKPVDSVTADKLKTAAKALIDGKASVSAVGDLYVLPFAEELGLQV